MILNSKETTVAYRCPKCGKMVFSVVGVFTLSGDMFKLKCGCGESELVIQYTSDRKIRLTVPCIVCPSPHTYVISSKNFFEEDVFRMSCPYSSVDICLVGEQNAVIEAAKQADEDFLKLLKMAGVEDFESFIAAKEEDDEHHSDITPDPEMQSIVHFMLCELEDDECITCKCGHHGHYEFKFVGSKLDNVLIYCTECSASVSIPLTDPVAANAFLHIDKLKLT
ncbi:MAG: hypothetical protein IKB51_07720 [Clostridia bacterium]|nr:hypothetical protein [Clostridia bacterium]